MTNHEKLLERIERLYAAIGATIGDEFKPLVEEDKETPGVFHIDLFGGESEAHAANLAHTAVYAVGNFFDHCKDFAKTSGIDSALVESVTEQSVELRIVRDLYNADKHPKAKPNTSG